MARALRRASVQTGDGVVVAFSGGADSLALLVLALRFPFEVEAIHVDHGLRPSSVLEAEQARALAASLGARARVVPVRVEGKGGLEAAARRARYRALAQAAGGRPILTAHTLDDQAETVLLRLARGTGLAGAAAIRPSTTIAGAKVIRPLLDVRRQELHRLVGALGVEPVEDPTNSDLRFGRNRLRAEVIPALEALAPGAVPALARFARLARADELLLAGLAAKEASRLGGEELEVEGLCRLPLALKSRIVRERIRAVAGRVPAESRVAEVLELLSKEEEGELHLAGGVLVRVRSGRLSIGRGPTGRRPAAEPITPDPPEELLPELPLIRREWVLEAAAGVVPAPQGDPAELWTQEPPPWQVREVRRGERLPVPGVGHRLASDLLGEAGIPVVERRNALVVEASGRPIWLVGVRPLCKRPAPGSRAWRLRVLRELQELPGADAWNEPASSPVGSGQRREERR